MKKETSVNIVMNQKYNHLLNISKETSGRTKRNEAAARLKDHLLRFQHQDSWEVQKK